MTSTGDFDPAKAVDFDQDKARERVRQQQAEKEAEKKRIREGKDQGRANKQKLLRHADEQLETIDDPVVSEFVVTERWYTPKRKKVLGVSPGEIEISKEDNFLYGCPFPLSLLAKGRRYKYRVATRHERQTRYCGWWLSLDTSSSPDAYDSDRVHYHGWSSREGWMKLRQPRAGYAHVRLSGYPHNVGYINIDFTDKHGRDLTDERGRKVPSRIDQYDERGYKIPSDRHQHFRVYEESLEELLEKVTSSTTGLSVENVARALNFVATGQITKPRS